MKRKPINETKRRSPPILTRTYPASILTIPSPEPILPMKKMERKKVNKEKKKKEIPSIPSRTYSVTILLILSPESILLTKKSGEKENQ